jgi:capsular polysaccharide transport system ATP-binding protein
MSVELFNVSKTFHAGGTNRPLFSGLNMRIDVGDRVGILGLPKSGKSTLLRMICGTEAIYEGAITRTSRVSWPIPLPDFLVNIATVAANIRFIERLYGQSSENFVHEIADKGDITEFLNQELGECPRHVRTQLAFALGVGVDFDIYLFEERIAQGSKEFKSQSLSLVNALGPNRGILLATNNPKEVSDHCKAVFVLDGPHAIHYTDVAQGINHFKSLKRNEDTEFDDRKEEVEVVDDDMGIGIGI